MESIVSEQKPDLEELSQKIENSVENSPNESTTPPVEQIDKIEKKIEAKPWDKPKNPTKDEYIKMYFETCVRLGKDPEYSRNKLKKTKKAELKEIVESLENDHNVYKGANDDDVYMEMTTNTVKKVLSKKRKKLVANGMYRFHLASANILELGIDPILMRRNLSIQGLADDIREKEKDFIPVIENMVENDPEKFDKLFGPYSMWGLLMAQTVGNRVRLNRKATPYYENDPRREQHLAILGKKDPKKKSTDDTDKRGDRDVQNVKVADTKKEKDLPLITTTGKSHII